MSSAYHEEISNNLDDIRNELRIANQLKLIELKQALRATGAVLQGALSELWSKLNAILTVTPTSSHASRVGKRGYDID